MTSNYFVRVRASVLSAVSSGFTAFLVLFFATIAWSQQPAASRLSTETLEKLRTPPQVFAGDAVLLGHYTASPKLRLTLALNPPHLEEERQFLRDLQDRTSPQFHQFLSQEQWIARFSPSEQDEQAVLDWATSQGLTVTHRYPNRLLVDLEAPVAAIESAFHVSINSYSLNGSSYFSNDRDPELPASLANIIISVQGLNNIQRMRPARRSTVELPEPDYVPGPVVAVGPSNHRDGSRKALETAIAAKRKVRTQGKSANSNITNGNYDPTDMYGSNAYNYAALQNLGHCCNPLNNPSGSPPDASIGIAAFGQFDSNDIIGFGDQYPYLAYNVQPIYIDGTPGCCGDEVTLDTEWSLAMANSFGSYLDTAEVFVYEGANGNNSTYTDMYNQMLSDGYARVFSTSWSCTEFYGCDSGTMDSRDNIFSEMVGEGWTLMAASGDRGATDDCTNRVDAAYPATDPNVIGVGGTYLQLYSNSTFDYEVAWQGGSYSGACSHNNGGSGGGCSAHYGAPGYQSSPACGAGSRSTPDISLNASHGQNYYYSGSLQGVGGTSISSPMLAGFMAQENAYLLYLGNICGVNNGTLPCAPMGNANWNIYYEGYNPAYAPHYPFYDITSGCNSNDITAFYGLGYYCAGTGYDDVTGWGTFNALQFAWMINWSTAADEGAPYLVFGGPTTGKWYNSDQIIDWDVYDSGGPYPATGVAGFSQAWDSDPGDVGRETTPGQGNSYYSGPQHPNLTFGCTDLSGAFCSGGVSQGCHTIHVRAWDNMGLGSGDQTYGPVCYDTITPSSGDSLSPLPNGKGWERSTVQVTLSASDPGAGSTGSGVAATYYAVDNSACYSGSLGSCSTYSAPFSIVAQGTHTVYFFAEDVAGNFEGLHAVGVYIDETAPHTTATLSGTLSGTAYSTPVTVTLNATDALSGVASTSYQVDGGSVQNYSGPFVVNTSGPHTVTFQSVDNAGNTETSENSSFTIKAATTTAVASSLNPSVHGQSVTFTITVTGTTSDGPTGTVQLMDGSTTLKTLTLVSGTANYTTSALAAGAHNITAVYSGATYFHASKSAKLLQDVLQKSRTVLNSSANPSSYKQAVTFTATVTPELSGTPAGTVTFSDGGTVLATRVLSNGVATFTTANLSVGGHLITAAYGGNNTYAASTSAALRQKVSKASTTTTVTSSLNPSKSGQTVKFTAKVVPQTSGMPTGSVNFRDGTTVIGTVALSSGHASLSTSTLKVGTHSITVQYGGDVNYTKSTTTVLSQIVNP